MAKRLGLSSKKITQIVRTYDNTKREVAGVLTVEAKVGPVVANVEFLVLDMPASFNLLLVRPWSLVPFFVTLNDQRWGNYDHPRRCG